MTSAPDNLNIQFGSVITCQLNPFTSSTNVLLFSRARLGHWYMDIASPILMQSKYIQYEINHEDGNKKELGKTVKYELHTVLRLNFAIH